MTAFTEIQAYPIVWKIAVGIFVVLTLFAIPRFDNKVRRLLIGFIIFIDAFAVYMVSRQLETKIDETGIYYKVFPTFSGEQKLSWEAVSTVSVGRIFWRRTKTQNFSCIIGNRHALYITSEDGKKIMLGTQKPTEMNAAIIEFSRARYQSAIE